MLPRPFVPRPFCRRNGWRAAVMVAALIVLSSVALTSSPSASADSGTATIKVGPNYGETGPGKPARPIAPTIVGGNHRWINSGLGMWDGDNNRPVPSAVAAGQGSHLGLVRYPGGTVANMFDFKRAIGDDRRCQIGAGFVGGLFSGQDSVYGPDEQQRFVHAIGARTMIMVPMINQSAQDAADYVEYMNAPVGTNPNGGIAWADRRAANGHPEPYKINTWEVGNEPYFPNQRYWRSVDDDTKLEQFIEGGAERQTGESPNYTDNDGLFDECDLGNRVTGDGTANQTYHTRYNSIRDPELTVNGQTWRLVEAFDDQAADARVYRIDAEEGLVTFGDGSHGAIPPMGAELSINYTTEQDGFVDYYQAIKEVDPSVSVCSGWGRPEFVEAMGDRPYDCVGFHMYTSPRAGDEDTPRYDAEQLYQHLMPLGAEAVGKLNRLNEVLAVRWPNPNQRPGLIVTEWGTLAKASPSGQQVPIGYDGMLMRVLYAGELAMGMVENGVQEATLSNLTGGAAGGVLGGAPNFFVTGQSQMMNLVHASVGGRMLTTALTDNPTAGDYRALRALSTRDADGVTRVLVINRDIDHPVTANLQLAGAGGGSNVTVTTLSGTAVDAYDSWDDPGQITRDVSHLQTQTPHLSHTFPEHSATLIELHPRT